MLAMKYVAANSEYSAVICFGVVVLASNVRVTCSMVVVLTSFVTVWGHSFGFRCRDNLLRSRDFDFRCRGNDYLFVFETFQRDFHHLAGDCLPIVGGYRHGPINLFSWTGRVAQIGSRSFLCGL